MLRNLTQYQAAFFLSILSAVITFILWGIVFRRASSTDTGLFWEASIIIPFGLWLGSNFVRYLGGIFTVIVAGSLLWPLLSNGLPPGRLPLAALFIFLAAINLVTAVILLLSKKFAAEFAGEQKQQPRYKYYMRQAIPYVVLGAMLVATLNDIIHLASSR